MGRLSAYYKLLKPHLITVSSIILFGLIWELVARLGFVDKVLFPPMSSILARLFEMSGPGDGKAPSFLMLRDIGATLFALLVGFFLAALVSSAIGFIMGINRTVYQWLRPIITMFMVVPNIATVPVIILWFGLGIKTVIIVVVMGSSFPIIYTAAAGVQSIPPKMIWAAQTTGASKWQILRTVVIPGTMPYLIAGHKLALGRAWRAVIAGEIFASTAYGIGYMIFDARTFFDTEAMFAGIIVVGLIGLILESSIFKFIEKATVVRWGMSTAKDL